MSANRNVTITISLVVLAVLIGVLAYFGPSLTGFASYGDNTPADCGAYVNEDSILAGNITNCSSDGLIINTSNVTLDCQGYWITFNESLTPTSEDGIIASGKENITVRNCNVREFNDGVYITNLNHSLLADNTAFNNTGHGFKTDECFNSTFANNSAYINSNDGIHNDNPVNCSYAGNVVFNNTANGFYFFGDPTANNTLMNNRIFNNYDGIFLWNSANSLYINNTIYNNTRTGYAAFTPADYDNTLQDNVFYGHQISIFINRSNNNNLINNTAYNSSYGVFIGNSENNTLVNNTAYNSSYGFYVEAVNNASLTNNVAYNITNEAFYILSSYEGSLEDNTAYGSGSAGFGIDSSVSTSLVNNSAHSNSWAGISLWSSNHSVLVNNSIFGNAGSGGIGVEVEDANSSLLTGNRFYNNKKDVSINYISRPFIYNLTNNYFLNPAGTLINYTVLGIDDNAGGAGDEYYINWSSPPAIPSVYASFENKFIKIETSGSPTIESAEWKWNDAELSGYYESFFELWVWNSSGSFDTGATLDTANNKLTISSLQPSSTYGILQFNAPLLIRDSSDTATILRADNITFYANFTNSTGHSINDSEANVTIDFESLGGTHDMGYNSATGVWEYTNNSMTTYNGTYLYTVTGNSTVQDTHSRQNDTYDVAFSCINLTKVSGTSYTIDASLIKKETLCTDDYADELVEVPPGSQDLVLDCNNSYLYGVTNKGGNAISVGSPSSGAAANTTVQNCRISDYFRGLIVWNATNTTLRNITIWNSNESYGGSLYSNIYINKYTDGLLIENVNLTGPDRGIYINSLSRNILIKDSTFYSTDIRWNNVHNLTFDNITDSGELGNRTLIRHFSELFGPSGYSENITITNSFFNNSFSLFLISAGYVRNLNISNNVFNNMYHGWGTIRISNEANDSFIYNNSFNNCFIATVITDGRNTRIFNNSANCFISAEGDNIIHDNVISGYTDLTSFGITLKAGGFYSVHDASGTLSIENNTVLNSGISILKLQNGSINLKNNDFINISTVLINSSKEGISVEDNYFANSTTGILISNSSFSNALNNMFENLDYAILVENATLGSSVRNINGNSFSNTGFGIFVKNSQGLSLSSANISNASYALQVYNSNLSNISGNILKGTAYDLLINGSNFTTLWNNAFISQGVNDSGTNTSYCVGNQGNFYEESLTPASGDCGQVSLTTGSFIDSISWNRQDASVPVNYEVYNNASGALVATKKSSASTVSIDNWPTATGNYKVNIIPWIEGSRINGTHFTGTFSFTISTKAKKTGGGGTSVNLPPTIGSFERNVTKNVTEEIVPAEPEEEVPAEEEPSPAPPVVEKPAPEVEPSLPRWVMPVTVAVIALLVVGIILYEYYKKPKIPKKKNNGK